MQDCLVTLVDGQPTAGLEWDDSLRTNALLSLYVQQGTWFADPEFGSRLHEIRKVTDDNIDLARDYCIEALQWMQDLGRVTAIEVTTERDRTDGDRINIAISMTRANDVVESLELFYTVV